MTTVSYRILLARDAYKFSVAHMTIFPDGTKERLHGHNYSFALALDVDRVDFAQMIPFADVKQVMTALVAEWKERVMIPQANPFVRITHDTATEIELTVCDQRYVFPRADVLLLPIDNISVEALAAHVAELFAARLPPTALAHITALEVRVEESPGQGSSCRLAFP